MQSRGCVKTLTQPFFMRKAQTFSSPGFVITKVFVSLGIKFFVMAKLHFRPTFPTKPFFFHKELMKT